jgi:predicted esterase
MIAKGYAVISADYYQYREINPSVRMTTEVENTCVKEACVDASLLMAFIDKNASVMGIDKNKVFLMGGSAGAMTCLKMCLVDKVPAPKVKAVIDMWGKLADLASITKDVPPVLIIHGDEDTTINISNSYSLKERLSELNVTCEMITMEGKGHAQYRYVADNYLNNISEFLSASIK